MFISIHGAAGAPWGGNGYGEGSSRRYRGRVTGDEFVACSLLRNMCDGGRECLSSSKGYRRASQAWRLGVMGTRGWVSFDCKISLFLG